MSAKHEHEEEFKASEASNETQIEEVFGKIFGVERVHVLQHSDRLQDVVEKLQVVPENKLVFVEANHNEEISQAGEESFTVHNLLTLGDMLNYLCPSSQENA